MKRENLADGITHIDDDLVEKAGKAGAKEKRNYRSIFIKAGTAAACIVIAVTALWQTGIINSPKESVLKTAEESKVSAYLLAKVAYPNGIPYDDIDSEIENREKNPVDEDFKAAIEKFSFNSGARLLSENQDNRLYSPISLFYALSLATEGASEDTRKEMLNTLGIKEDEDLSSQCGNLYRLMYTENEYSSLRVANSLWLDKSVAGQSIKYNEDYLKKAAQSYYASVYEADFEDEKTARNIGQWIQENTNGTLGKDYSVDPGTAMSLINTIYFRSQWINKFEKNDTKEDKFYLADGDTVKSDFMNRDYTIQSFSEGDDFVRSSLPLKNGSMDFILPDEGVSVEELVKSPEKLEQCFNGGKEVSGKVLWSIPKFSYNTSMNMNEALQSLGMEKPFSQEADFSNISDGGFYISKIAQDTHVAIDENGVEASAFTKIDYSGCPMPDGKADMILNRPFIYGIRSQDGTLLFIGICSNPSK